MRTTHRRPVVLGVLAALTTLTTAACSAPEADAPAAAPVVAASPSPSLDAAEQLEAENVEAAQQVLTDFYDEYNEVSHAGWKGWEQLGRYWAPSDVWTTERAVYVAHAERGLQVEGDAEVVSMETVDYTTPDETAPGHETVTIDLCLDTSGTTAYDEDGTEVQRAKGFPARFVSRYEVGRMGADAPWLITDREQKVDETC